MYKSDFHIGLYVYDSQKAKSLHGLNLTQHEISLIQYLDKFMTNHTDSSAFSDSGMSSLGDKDKLNAFQFFEIEHESKSSESHASQQFSDFQSDENSTNNSNKEKNHSSHVNFGTNNGKHYMISRSSIENYLSNLSKHIHLEGELIRPKPINVHIIKLSRLLAKTKHLFQLFFRCAQNHVHISLLQCSPNKSTADHQSHWFRDKVKEFKKVKRDISTGLSDITDGSVGPKEATTTIPVEGKS